jgi:hypothetical protein
MPVEIKMANQAEAPEWMARMQGAEGGWHALGTVTDFKITPSRSIESVYGFNGGASGSVSVDLTPEESNQFSRRLREILDREMTNTLVPTTLFGGPRPQYDPNGFLIPNAFVEMLNDPPRVDPEGPSAQRPSRDYSRPCMHCQAGLIPGRPGQWDGTPGEDSHDCPECKGTGYEERFVRHEGPALEGCWPPGTGIPRPRPGIELPPQEIGQVNVESAVMRIVADDRIEPGVVHFFDAYDYRPGGTVTANTVTMKGINWQGIEPMSASTFDRIFRGLVEKEARDALKPVQPRPAIEQQILFEDRNW